MYCGDMGDRSHHPLWRSVEDTRGTCSRDSYCQVVSRQVLCQSKQYILEKVSVLQYLNRLMELSLEKSDES